MIGVVNTLVDLGVFLVAHNVFALPLVPANVLAWLVAVSGSYVMNSFITFAHESGAAAAARLRRLRRLRHRRGRHQHHRAGHRRLLDAGAVGEAFGDPGELSWSISRCRTSWCSAPATGGWRRLPNDPTCLKPARRRCVVRRQPDRRAADLRHASGMLGDRRALSGRRAAQPLARGKPLLVRYDLDGVRKALSKEARRPPRPLALSRAPPGARHTRDIVSLGEAVTRLRRHAQARRARRRRDPGQGRGPAADRPFKARGLVMAVSMAKALGRRLHGDADERQCRRRARRLCARRCGIRTPSSVPKTRRR